MQTPHVIEYLKTHTFAELEDAHGVCARPSVGLNKFSLNYDQIKVKNGDPVAEQCRGLIIRPKNLADVNGRSKSAHTENIFAKDASWRTMRFAGGFEVVAWPMCRFYNFGDASVAGIDWNDPRLRVYEKVDGTCIIVYWDPAQGRWHCATRSVPEADLPIRGDSLEIGDMTFAELFLMALVFTVQEQSGKNIDMSCVKGPDDVLDLNKDVTYVFELVSIHNRIVVTYNEPRVYLLAARNVRTGQEIHPDDINIEHVRRPRSWPLNNALAVATFVNSFKGTEMEGAVACIPNGPSFPREKIKNIGYVMDHRAKDTTTASPRNTLEAIICERIDDVIPLVTPEIADKMVKMKDSYAAMCHDIDTRFAAFKQAAGQDRKAFAGMVLASKDWSPPHFNMWEGRADSAHGWIKAMHEKGKLSSSALDKIIEHMNG